MNSQYPFISSVTVIGFSSELSRIKTLFLLDFHFDSFAPGCGQRAVQLLGHVLKGKECDSIYPFLHPAAKTLEETEQHIWENTNEGNTLRMPE